ncbi:hypothetical protein [Thermogemmatispora sp.]|uniref:hypothetical protein n=1 Tax=Thermogemmatispora sp. TaxID=1968838 RepID=UPI001DB7EF7A|nr:hypothetical protein [Thermogemmatispora sp.]MBX5452055.1 hypothetical protein [Thermogemmatispora sp.]
MLSRLLKPLKALYLFLVGDPIILSGVVLLFVLLLLLPTGMQPLHAVLLVVALPIILAASLWRELH